MTEMRNILTAIFTTVVITTIPTASAQGPVVGVKVGLNYSDLYGDDVGSSESLQRFCVGTFVGFPISDMVTIQPELLYTQKGTKWDLYDPVVAAVEKAWVKLTYVEIPILTKIVIRPRGNVKPHICSGPYLGVNIAARGTMLQDGEVVEREIIGDVNDIDLGVVSGIGIDVDLGKGAIVIDTRYVLGLSGIDEDGQDVRNKVFSFILGYAF
jgi:hypothetical protein